MNKPTPGQRTDNDAAEQRLAPIRAWAHANHGMVKTIADRLSTLTGKPVMRQTVGRWLHKDPDKRQQPSYGFGLLLEDVVRDLQEEQSKQTPV